MGKGAENISLITDLSKELRKQAASAERSLQDGVQGKGWGRAQRLFCLETVSCHLAQASLTGLNAKLSVRI